MSRTSIRLQEEQVCSVVLLLINLVFVPYET